MLSRAVRVTGMSTTVIEPLSVVAMPHHWHYSKAPGNGIMQQQLHLCVSIGGISPCHAHSILEDACSETAVHKVQVAL